MNIVIFSHPDYFGSKSIIKYVDLLARGMREKGHNVEIWKPKSFFYNLTGIHKLKKWFGYIDQFIYFPIEVLSKLDSLLESTQLGKGKTLKFSRFTTIRIYSISIIITIILPILLFLYLSSSLSWSISNGNYEVNNITYNFWIDISKLLTLITLFFFSINIIIGIIEYERQIIIFSLNGLIISIGLLIYLNQKDILFLDILAMI